MNLTAKDYIKNKTFIILIKNKTIWVTIYLQNNLMKMMILSKPHQNYIREINRIFGLQCIRRNY